MKIEGVCKVLVVLAFAVCGVMPALGQGQPSDIMRAMSVDIQRRGGENVLYKNGEKLNKRQAKVLFELSPQAQQTLRKAYRHRAAGHTLFAFGGGVTGLAIGLACDDVHWGACLGLAVVGGGIAATGIPLIRSYNMKTSQAVEIYNRAVFDYAMPRRTTAELKMGITGSGGFGLTLVF